MARHPLARVIHNQLTGLAESDRELPPILVGTHAWYDWLNAPETRSFSYDALEGRLTVRRELRQNGWYWYAYRTRQGKVRKVYLGKSEELSEHRLAHAFSQLSEPHTQQTRPQAKHMPAKSQSVILKTKLMLPPLPEHLVSRPRLVQLLQTGAAKPLILVCAPAGFGKTVLMREWAAQSERPCAWISLDREENDPRRFLAYLREALQYVQPTFGSDLLANSPSPSSLALTEMLTLLLNELLTLPSEITIIFDNYQAIKNQRIHDALAFLLEHLPPHIHLLIASRSRPSFPLARLRASGKMVALHADALRFTHEEIVCLLLTNMQLPLEATELAILEQRTEGWVAGLYLASATLQEQPDLERGIAAFTGCNNSLVAYIREEVLASQPEHIQSFLLATSLLECFNNALCSAVIGQTDAEYLLEQVVHAQALLFPCDQHAGWYRYPRLWAEALRHHLERTQPELAAVVCTRASQWFEEQGMTEKAICHALAARDETRAAALIEGAAPGLLERGEITTLHQWLGALPDAVVRASPRLCISKAWLTFITTQADLFLAWVEAAEQALKELQQEVFSSLLVDEMQTEIVGLRAFYRVSYNDSARAIVACNQALLQLPAENLYPRSLLLLALGFAYARGRSVSAGAQALLQASSVLQGKGHALLLPYLMVGQAEISQAQGLSAQVAKLCRQILSLAVEQNVPAVFSAGLAHYGLGHMFWEWNNLEMAKSHLLQAWDLAMQTQTVNTLLLASVLLVQVNQAQGEPQETDFWLHQIEELGQRTGLRIIREFAASLRARLWLAAGELEAALFWMQEHRADLEVPDMRSSEFKRFTQVRVLLTAARAHADETSVRQALNILNDVCALAEEVGNVRVLLEALMLQALALQLAGNQAAALTALASAISLAEPGRYIRLFVSEGDPLARMVRHLLEQQRAQKISGQTLNLTYLSNLLKAFAMPTISSPSASPGVGEPLLDPLSWREHEVLRLLATGRKNREIADELVVVTGTVKAHIYTIYQKLGVNSRIQAVERARTLGLL